MIAVLVAGLSLSGCKEADWGEKAKKFVDEKAGPLSRMIAKAELDKRWQESVHTFNTGTLLQVDAHTQLLSRVHLELPPESGADFETLQRYVAATRQTLNRITDIEIGIRRTEASLAAYGRVCESTALFSALNFDTVLSSGLLQINLPTPNYKVEVSTDIGQALLSMLTANLVASSVSRQNELFREAVAAAPAKLVTTAELFEMSRESCQRQKEKYAHLQPGFALALSKQAKLAGEFRKLLNGQRFEPERRYVRAIRDRILAREDFGEISTELDNASFDAQVLLQVSRAVAEVHRLIEQREAASGCAEYQSLSEQLVGYATEAILQSKAVTIAVAEGTKTGIDMAIAELSAFDSLDELPQSGDCP